MIITKEFLKFYREQSLSFAEELHNLYLFYYSSNTSLDDVFFKSEEIINLYDFAFYANNRLYFEDLAYYLKERNLLNKDYYCFIMQLFEFYIYIELHMFSTFTERFYDEIILNKSKTYLYDMINAGFDMLEELVDR